MLYRFKDWIYRAKYWIFKRDCWAYVPTPQMKPGYADPRERVLHAVMQMVVEYFDEETMENVIWRADYKTYMGDSNFNMNEEQSHEQAQVYIDLLKVFDYWTTGRDALDQNENEIFDRYTKSHTHVWEKNDGKDEYGDFFTIKRIPNEGYDEKQIKELLDEWLNMSRLVEDTEQQMVELAIKHRRYMWS